MSYNVTELNPYTQYLVKVAAVNGVGEGHIVNGTATTEEESKPTTSFFFSTSDKKLHSVSVI